MYDVEGRQTSGIKGFVLEGLFGNCCCIWRNLVDWSSQSYYSSLLAGLLAVLTVFVTQLYHHWIHNWLHRHCVISSHSHEKGRCRWWCCLRLTVERPVSAELMCVFGPGCCTSLPPPPYPASLPLHLLVPVCLKGGGWNIQRGLSVHNVPPLVGCVAGCAAGRLNCIKEANLAGHRPERAEQRAPLVSSFWVWLIRIYGSQ